MFYIYVEDLQSYIYLLNKACSFLSSLCIFLYYYKYLFILFRPLQFATMIYGKDPN